MKSSIYSVSIALLLRVSRARGYALKQRILGFQKAHSLCAAKVTDEAFHLSASKNTTSTARNVSLYEGKEEWLLGTDQHYMLMPLAHERYFEYAI